MSHKNTPVIDHNHLHYIIIQSEFKFRNLLINVYIHFEQPRKKIIITFKYERTPMNYAFQRTLFIRLDEILYHRSDEKSDHGSRSIYL